jgi:hypothetical protein
MLRPVFLPETKGLSLEHIDLLFHDKVGTLKSIRWRQPASSEMVEVEEEDVKESKVAHVDKV